MFGISLFFFSFFSLSLSDSIFTRCAQFGKTIKFCQNEEKKIRERLKASLSIADKIMYI